MLDRKDFDNQLRSIQLDALYKLVQQLDFELLTSETHERQDAQQALVGLDDLCRLVSVNLLGQIEWLASNWDPGSAQDSDVFDVRYCALCVATAIITRSSRVFFEQRGLAHLSMLLRAIREPSSTDEMRKGHLLVSLHESNAQMCVMPL